MAEALIWTGWLTLLVSRRLPNVVREALPVEWRERLPYRRWATASARVAGDLLNRTLWVREKGYQTFANPQYGRRPPKPSSFK